MADDSPAFRLRHARHFHLQRLYHRNRARFVITLLIATLAIHTKHGVAILQMVT